MALHPFLTPTGEETRLIPAPSASFTPKSGVGPAVLRQETGAPSEVPLRRTGTGGANTCAGRHPRLGFSANGCEWRCTPSLRPRVKKHGLSLRPPHHSHPNRG